MAPRTKSPSGTGGGPPRHPSGGPAAGVTSATHAAQQAATAGTPNAASGTGTPAPPPAARPAQPTHPAGAPPMPTAPLNAADIHHSAKSVEHIAHGDGGRSGGHLAGTGFSGKTEFPRSWNVAKIKAATYEVTQMGPPVKGPLLTRDADGNPAWAYNYEGMVDGVNIRTVVLETGEIRTSFPKNGRDMGVIENPPAPHPPPPGIPQGVPPRYSHPSLGGDGSWTWEGPKGNEIRKIVKDAHGIVHGPFVLGPYQKK
ncbi:hypothetical protein AB0E59_21775 [Lentzea sp. NPDC034063]|uniref:hypothetical protein n=1 Tax=unclassified Lentzea TaxID=2643253 RepID=UPI0033EC7016